MLQELFCLFIWAIVDYDLQPDSNRNCENSDLLASKVTHVEAHASMRDSGERVQPKQKCP